VHENAEHSNSKVNKQLCMFFFTFWSWFPREEWCKQVHQHLCACVFQRAYISLLKNSDCTVVYCDQSIDELSHMRQLCGCATIASADKHLTTVCWWITVCLSSLSCDNGEIAYFSVRWKTIKLIKSATPKPRTKTDDQSRNGKRSH